MTKDKALELALEALECANSPNGDYENEITVIKVALAEHAMIEVQRLGQEIEQEPYCFVYKENGEEFFAPKDGYYPADATPLYAHPPQRTEPLIGCVNHDCAKCKEKST
jgi:hypothetical protein